jgi:hypothetical protein
LTSIRRAKRGLSWAKSRARHSVMGEKFRIRVKGGFKMRKTGIRST